MSSTRKTTTAPPEAVPTGAARFVFDVDDTTYEHDRPTITGAEIMAVAGINPSDGLIQILLNGTRETVDPDDRVQLVPGIQFKRRPRFKRG